MIEIKECLILNFFEKLSNKGAKVLLAKLHLENDKDLWIYSLDYQEED